MIELLLSFLVGCCVGIAPWHWLAKKNERLAREGRTFVPDNAELVRAVAFVLYCQFEGRKPETPPQGHWLVAARAVLAVAERTERDEHGKVMICTGCGSTDRVDWLRATRPGTIACCPERKMVQAADRIEAFEFTLREIARTDDTGTVTHRLECRQRLARAVLEERG